MNMTIGQLRNNLSRYSDDDPVSKCVGYLRDVLDAFGRPSVTDDTLHPRCGECGQEDCICCSERGGPYDFCVGCGARGNEQCDVRCPMIVG